MLMFEKNANNFECYCQYCGTLKNKDCMWDGFATYALKIKLQKAKCPQYTQIYIKSLKM